jgi:hypothetical protein
MYSIGINNTWTTDGKATPEFFESKGCIVKKSRLIGDFDVFKGGRRIASIFKSKEDQKQHLNGLGLT